MITFSNLQEIGNLEFVVHKSYLKTRVSEHIYEQTYTIATSCANN